MISGYFLIEKNERNLLKVIQLIFQVIAFSEFIYLARGVIGERGFSLKGILLSLIPNNYFVILYCVLFILSPLVNFSISRISDKHQMKTLCVLILLFSVCPSIVDVMNLVSNNNWNGLSTIGMYGSQWGYTIVNFFLMYCLGAFIRKIDISRIKWYVLVIAQSLLIVVITLLASFNEDIAWSYCSPLVILESVLFMLLFLKINIGSVEMINSLSKACFTCFLTHTVFLKFVGIKRFSSSNPLLLIVHVVLTSVAIFIVCYVVNLVYSILTSSMWKKIDQQKLIVKYEEVEQV